MNLHAHYPSLILGKQVEIPWFNGQFLQKCPLPLLSVLICLLLDWASQCCHSIWIWFIFIYFESVGSCHVNVAMSDFFWRYAVVEINTLSPDQIYCSMTCACQVKCSICKVLDILYNCQYLRIIENKPLVCIRYF